MACSTCHNVRAAILSALGGGNDDVEMQANYTHKVGAIHVKYSAGNLYRKVPAVVAKAIVAAKAGRILDADA